ncbi:hypothetical protein [Actinoallomurus iriomotensis]|uniref:hypothetical protein n=1 Tax=Actinoallomurus iriomotensis TaxID=478107 RepID=UPI0025553361|nr:hypothetical protein [Actinoallomurus iriomotensis]
MASSSTAILAVALAVTLFFFIIWLIAHISNNRLTRSITTIAINKADAADLPKVLTALSARPTPESPKLPSIPFPITIQLIQGSEPSSPSSDNQIAA